MQKTVIPETAHRMKVLLAQIEDVILLIKRDDRHGFRPFLESSDELQYWIKVIWKTTLPPLSVFSTSKAS